MSASSGIDNEEARHAFSVTQQRIKAIALVHQSLYESKDFSFIDFRAYVQNLVGDLRNSYGLDAQSVTLVIEDEDVHFGVDTAVRCGIVINELVSDSLKNAFPDGCPGVITIRCFRSSSDFTLLVNDDGVGLSPGFDLENRSSLGMVIVRGLTSQLRGKLEYRNNNGAEFCITFPEPE